MMPRSFKITLESWSSWANSTRTSDDSLDFLMNTFVKLQTFYPHLNGQSDLLTLALSQPQTSWVVSLHNLDDDWSRLEHRSSLTSFSDPQTPTAAGMPLASFGSGDGLPASDPGDSDIMLTFNGTSDQSGPSTSLLQNFNTSTKLGQPSNDMDFTSSTSGLLEPLDDIFSPPPFRQNRIIELPPSPMDMGIQRLANGLLGTCIVGLAFAELTDENISMEVLTGGLTGRARESHRPGSSENSLKYDQATCAEPNSYEISVLLDFQGVRDQFRASSESSLSLRLTEDVEEELIRETIFELLLELEPTSITMGVAHYRMILFNHLISDLEYPVIYSAILSMGFKGQDVDFDSKMIAPVQVFTMQMSEWEDYKESHQSSAPKVQESHNLAGEGKDKGKGKEKVVFE